MIYARIPIHNFWLSTPLIELNKTLIPPKNSINVYTNESPTRRNDQKTHQSQLETRAKSIAQFLAGQAKQIEAGCSVYRTQTRAAAAAA